MSKIIVTFDKEQMVSVISKAISVIPKKPLIPINEFFMFEIIEDKCNIYASDDHMTLRCSTQVTANVNSASFCIPAKLFSDTIKLLHEPTFTITVMDHAAQLKSGKSKYKMAAENADYFGMIEEVDHTSEVAIVGSQFKEGFSIASSYVNKKVDNALRAVNISIKDGLFNFIGGQTAILAKVRSKPHSLNQFKEISIPNATAEVLEYIFPDKDVVDIFHDDRTVMFDNGSMRLLCTVSNLKYPNTANFFSRENSTYFKVNTSYLLDAVKRVLLYADEGTYAAVFTITCNNLMITAQNDLVNSSGEEHLEILFDQNYTVAMSCYNLIHVLESFRSGDIMGAEFIRVYLNENPKLPLIFTEDSDEPLKEFIVCPMQLNK